MCEEGRKETVKWRGKQSPVVVEIVGFKDALPRGVLVCGLNIWTCRVVVVVVEVETVEEV